MPNTMKLEIDLFLKELPLSMCKHGRPGKLNKTVEKTSSLVSLLKQHYDSSLLGCSDQIIMSKQKWNK